MHKRLGLFGGTFNPIHNGHIQMAKSFLEELNLNRLLILPTGNSYHKLTTAVSDLDRYNMCSIAFAGFNKIEISKIDLERSGATYTIDTLAIITKNYPNYDLWWLLGSDSFLTLDNWHRYQDLFNLTSFAIALRNSQSIDDIIQKNSTFPHPAHYQILKMPEYPINSTELRKDIKQKNASELKKDLPEGVISYILSHRLYL